MNRQELAERMAAGLAGWLQLQHVQNMGGLSGEDTARSIACQIVNAQGRFSPATSQLPANWGTTKKRIDVALKGRSEGATTWYGAIELKWPGEAFDAHQVRQAIVQDVMRLSFVQTNLMNAKFLVVGGTTTSLAKLFDTPHPNGADRETRRTRFGALLSRQVEAPQGVLTTRNWTEAFPEAGTRIPEGLFADFDGRLKAKLLARGDASLGQNVIGSVFVWQCNRTRGTAADT